MFTELAKLHQNGFCFFPHFLFVVCRQLGEVCWFDDQNRRMGTCQLIKLWCHEVRFWSLNSERLLAQYIYYDPVPCETAQNRLYSSSLYRSIRWSRVHFNWLQNTSQFTIVCNVYDMLTFMLYVNLYLLLLTHTPIGAMMISWIVYNIENRAHGVSEMTPRSGIISVILLQQSSFYTYLVFLGGML